MEINPLQRNRDNEVHLLWKRYAAWKNRHAGSFSDVVSSRKSEKSRLSKIIFEGGMAIGKKDYLWGQTILTDAYYCQNAKKK